MAFEVGDWSDSMELSGYTVLEVRMYVLEGNC